MFHVGSARPSWTKAPSKLASIATKRVTSGAVSARLVSDATASTGSVRTAFIALESALMGHPAVAEAAVIPVASAKWSERPLACVALAEGADVTPEQLREHLCSGLANWQVPEAFAFIDEVPKTSVGKFDKKVLRSRHEKGDLTVETLA
jgi:acyl-CoA synthetase (AMP-forming)/AMP-acid ligase II